MSKLSNALPSPAANGLDSIDQALIDDPQRVHVVIAIVDCKSTTTDNDTGDIVPTARIRRIEPVGEQDQDAVTRMLLRQYERRTGAVTLPYEIKEDLHGLLTGGLKVDKTTGEVRD